MGRKTKKEVGAVVRSHGVSFRVWAPFAESVGLSGTFNDWGETAMESEGDGYWFAEVREASAGQEYKYVIHNGDKIIKKNDPRSLTITTLAGNSVIVDTAFDWQDDKHVYWPREKQIIYELHIGTFNRLDPATIGTFESAMQKLDYLRDLGINTIELMPIGNMMVEREWWGYTPEYIYSVENLYGGRYQLLEFIKAAHQKGIMVILDVVYNHFATDQDLNMWQFDGWSENDKGGIYFYNDFRSATPWGDTRPDYGRAEVRQFILDNARMWLWDCHIDGLRVDSTIYIRNLAGKNDDPEHDIADGWYLLQRINTVAKKINPQSFVVAEDIGVNDYLLKPVGEGGAAFDAQWEVNFPEGIRGALRNNQPADIHLDTLIDQLKRRFDGDPMRRVVYIDSHDSAANGSARFSELIAPKQSGGLFAREQSVIAAAIIMTTPGIPMILNGQEFMQGGSFNDWQGLDWSRVEKYSGIVEAYKHLISLRQNAYGLSAGLTGPNIDIFHVDQVNKVIAYRRWLNGGPGDDVIVLINFSNKSIEDYEFYMPANGTWRVRFNSTWDGYSKDFKNINIDDVNVNSNKTSINLPSSCVLLFSQDPA